jgi:aconitate hydratase
MCDVSAIPGADALPRALVVLLENVVRRAASDDEAVAMAKRVLAAGSRGDQGEEIEFMPSRVLFQDFTGVPVFCDFAAMRDAVSDRGGDPSVVNPHIPCTLVVDHSVVADVTGSPDASSKNLGMEASRNSERFSFLKWASKSFDNVEIVPPGAGICHQLNIERFCKVVSHDALSDAKLPVACFDTLVGTDSHTTTANGIGVLGWGVGGIEAEAAALGQPISMRVPEVVGLELVGSLGDGICAMDLALTVAQRLRAEGVVGCLVEAFGEGVPTLTVTQRACVANMTPEYGATSTLFPVDDNVLDYLELTGRDPESIALVGEYARRQHVFGQGEGRTYSRVVRLDLSEVRTSLAGPSRPHDRVEPSGLKERVESACADHGHGDLDETFSVSCADGTHELAHGALAIAAVTSCTTATDPAMMVAAGLLARKAVEHGLEPKPWVKKVLAPGSHATDLLLRRAGLMESLNALGFYTCGFGCMSCIGNSGPVLSCLDPVKESLELTSVLSGNRNFDGRISPDVSQNSLCQPALVVAYSMVGTMDIDLTHEPIGVDGSGSPVMLADVMPSTAEIDQVLDECLDASLFSEGMAGLLDGDSTWSDIEIHPSSTYQWDEASTYVRRPPYFEIARKADSVAIGGARALVCLGDFVTTDHISPAGAIAADSPAAAYLEQRSVTPRDFNTYGSRRGNHEVMARGTFANVKLQNRLADGRTGCWTLDQVDGSVKSVFDASEDYRSHDVPLVILAGRMYGSGSSRDWAAKGPLLQGVRAVIAESFERIHRSNLVQMGILPLEFMEGEGADRLGLNGTETFDVSEVMLGMDAPASQRAKVTAHRRDGSTVTFECLVRIDTATEGAYMAAGGILPYVLDQMSS